MNEYTIVDGEKLVHDYNGNLLKDGSFEYRVPLKIGQKRFQQVMTHNIFAEQANCAETVSIRG